MAKVKSSSGAGRDKLMVSPRTNDIMLVCELQYREGNYESNTMLSLISLGVSRT